MELRVQRESWRWGIVFFIVGIFTLSALLPVSWIEQGPPLCFIKYFSGIDCPGCGLTRAFFYLFHGDWYHAIVLNAMAPVLVLWFSIQALRQLVILKRGKSPPWFSPQGNQVITRWFGLLFFGQWILKLVPIFEQGLDFSLLP